MHRNGQISTSSLKFDTDLSFLALFFTVLHGMQTRSSDEKAVRLFVRPSVCPSVKRVDCNKTEERSIQIIPYERSFSLVY